MQEYCVARKLQYKVTENWEPVGQYSLRKYIYIYIYRERENYIFPGATHGWGEEIDQTTWQRVYLSIWNCYKHHISGHRQHRWVNRLVHVFNLIKGFNDCTGLIFLAPHSLLKLVSNWPRTQVAANPGYEIRNQFYIDLFMNICKSGSKRSRCKVDIKIWCFGTRQKSLSFLSKWLLFITATTGKKIVWACAKTARIFWADMRTSTCFVYKKKQHGAQYHSKTKYLYLICTANFKYNISSILRLWSRVFTVFPPVGIVALSAATRCAAQKKVNIK
jgi:hypothetical protein